MQNYIFFSNNKFIHSIFAENKLNQDEKSNDNNVIYMPVFDGIQIA